jgi:hypothetical protein
MFHEGAQSLCPQKAKSDTVGAETAFLDTAASWIADIGAVADSSSRRKRKDDFNTLEVWVFGSIVQM